VKLQTKLAILGTATVAAMLLVLTFVQIQIGQQFIVETAERRVARNIATGWQILEMRQRELDLTVSLCDGHPEGSATWERARDDVDVLSEVDLDDRRTGTVAAAVASRFTPGNDGKSRGFAVLEPGDLANEDVQLVERCRIDGQVVPTLALFSARRTSDGGVLVAAQLLTRADALLGRVQQGLFGDERFEGRRTGTVTIFTGTMRTTTTVEKEDRSSAVGTRVSDEVARG
jgi:hypothetical protein